MICDARPRRISRREPTTPTSFPAITDTIITLALYGNRSNPASVGEKPRTFCRYCVITSNIPYTANITANIVMIASEYVRSRKSFRSIIGSALLLSQKMNAASAAPATTNSVRICPESQPACGPSITANAKAPTAVMNRSCPGISNLRGRSSRDSATKRHVRARTTSPTGTLTMKIERQPVRCTMKPPSVGPIAMAVLAIAVQIPIAQGFNFGSGNAALTSASEVTFTVAAATPWTVRARLRTSSEDAMPQAAEAAVEENDAAKVELPAAVDVRERTGRHHGNRHPEAVRRDHPLQACLAYLEVRLDGRQCDVHDQRIQKDHKEAEARGREGEALRPGHWALEIFSKTRVPCQRQMVLCYRPLSE